jgi:glycosyltransferase involved in cell wall biosynthesis
MVVPSQDILTDLCENIGLSQHRLPMRRIPNPVDVADVRLKAAEEPEQRDLLSGTMPVILGVGRLARQKNFGLLIRAFSRLRKERPARLLLLGSGPERERLESLVAALSLEEDVLMPGMVRNPFPYMARADVFALSSEEEGFGLVLVEAMAIGLPIVATRCPGGPSEILEEGKCGILVSTGDEVEMANALNELLDHAELRKRLIQAGLGRAREFSPDRIADQWLAFIGEGATG